MLGKAVPRMKSTPYGVGLAPSLKDLRLRLSTYVERRPLSPLFKSYPRRPSEPRSPESCGALRRQGGGQDVFVHISAVERAGLRSLNEGQAIEFELVSNRGKTAAENLRVRW